MPSSNSEARKRQEAKYDPRSKLRQAEADLVHWESIPGFGNFRVWS